MPFLAVVTHEFAVSRNEKYTIDHLMLSNTDDIAKTNATQHTAKFDSTLNQSNFSFRFCLKQLHKRQTDVSLVV